MEHESRKQTESLCQTKIIYQRLRRAVVHKDSKDYDINKIIVCSDKEDGWYNLVLSQRAFTVKLVVVRVRLNQRQSAIFEVFHHGIRCLMPRVGEVHVASILYFKREQKQAESRYVSRTNKLVWMQ